MRVAQYAGISYVKAKAVGRGYSLSSLRQTYSGGHH